MRACLARFGVSPIRLTVSVTILILLCIVAPPAQGQVTSGQVFGSVRDTSGADDAV